MSFLSSIISAALPVAKIAAQVLPELLAAVPGDAAGDSQAVPPVSATLLDFLGDEQEQKVYAVNNTQRSLLVSFQNNVDVAGVMSVQSESFAIPPRNAATVTEDIFAYSDSGVVSMNYSHDDDSDLLTGPGARTAMIALPFVAATSFVAFGGKVAFERSTVEEAGKRIDRWAITSDSNLRFAHLHYKTQNGQDINFNAELDPGRAAGDSGPNVYHIDTSGVGLATGLLTDFDATLTIEAADLAALLSARELTSFDDLPDHLRSRLRNA